MAYVRAWREKLEEEQRVTIEFAHDPRLEYPAKTEVMWHQAYRTSHVIRYREAETPTLPHLLGRALQQLALEHAARMAQRNRFFTTTPETRREARNAISAEIKQLQRSGMVGSTLDGYVDRLIIGLTNQLYSMPLDMVIEHFLYRQHPTLRPSQFVSLAATHATAEKLLTQPEIQEMTPHQIYLATATMNGAYALFSDELFDGATDYAGIYTDSQFFRKSRQLYGHFLDRIANYRPGDEYELVDDIAATLRLQRWYAWRADEPRPVEEAGGVTNPELLQEKALPAVMYCLAALQHFEEMSREEILPIISEIAVLGQSGLDYASPEPKYRLASLPEKAFSGLELMCLMYVGFKDIEPTLDIGFDLREPYEMALKMHNG